MCARRLVPFEGEAVAVEARPDPTGDGDGAMVVAIGDRTIRVHVRRAPDGSWAITRDDDRRTFRAVVSRDGAERWVTTPSGTRRVAEVDESHGAPGARPEHDLEAPMPGKVLTVEVAPGDPVTEGQVLLIVEAMKMEHAIRAPRDGIVAEIVAAAGDMVSPGTALVTFVELAAS